MSPIEIKMALEHFPKANQWVSVPTPSAALSIGPQQWEEIRQYVSNLETCITQMLIEKYSQSSK